MDGLKKADDRHTMVSLQIDAVELTLESLLTCLLDEVEKILQEELVPLYSHFLQMPL